MAAGAGETHFSHHFAIAELANDIAWDAVGAQIEPYLRQHA